MAKPLSRLLRLFKLQIIPSCLLLRSISLPASTGETGEVQSIAITASETAFLGLPKTGFFLQEGWNHVGKLRYIDYGLPFDYIEESEADFLC